MQVINFSQNVIVAFIAKISLKFYAWYYGDY
jgi:hypothetical protein